MDVNEIVGGLRSAKDDNDIIAGLALVPKLVDVKDWKQVIDAVPVDFLRRLLISETLEQVELGTSVLSTLLSFDNGNLTDHFLQCLVPCTHNIFKRNMRTKDHFWIVEQIVERSDSRKSGILHELYPDQEGLDIMDESYMDSLLDFVLVLVKNNQKLSNWSEFMDAFVHKIEISHDCIPGRVFHLLVEHINRVHNLMPINGEKPPKWSTKLRQILAAILQGPRKDTVVIGYLMQLCHTLFMTYGYAWIVAEGDFMKLLCKLTFMELRMAVDRPLQEISVEAERVLMSCCGFVENCIELCEAEDSPIPDSTAMVVTDSLHTTANFILAYFLEANNTHIKIPYGVSLPLVRLSACFMAVGGIDTIQKETLAQAFPVLIKCSHNCLLNEGTATNIVALLLPCISHLPASLVSPHVLSLLLDYLRLLWIDFAKEKDSKSGDVVVERLIQCISVILNVPPETLTQPICEAYLNFMKRRVESANVQQMKCAPLSLYTAALALFVLEHSEALQTNLNSFDGSVKVIFRFVDEHLEECGEQDLDVLCFAIRSIISISGENQSCLHKCQCYEDIVKIVEKRREDNSLCIDVRELIEILHNSFHC